VFSENEVVTFPGEASLDETIVALADAAVAEEVTA
jgi:hypothetical protein